MGAHFTWFDLLHIDHKQTAVAASILVTFLIILLSLVANLALGKGESAIQPAGSISLKGFFEAFTEMIDGMVQMILGHHGRIYIPFFGTIFFYIVLNNLFGLLPGMTAATADINCALALGLFSFAAYNYFGFKHAGAHYFMHFVGPIRGWKMAPIILLILGIEIISNCVRPLSLGIRLSVNLQADHTVLGTFIDLTKVIIPVIFYGLGTFVSLVQAFVFTVLSMVYVMMATADEH